MHSKHLNVYLNIHITGYLNVDQNVYIIYLFKQLKQTPTLVNLNFAQLSSSFFTNVPFYRFLVENEEINKRNMDLTLLVKIIFRPGIICSCTFSHLCHISLFYWLPGEVLLHHTTLLKQG